MVFASSTKKNQACIRVSLNGGLERPVCEAVKLQPGLPWKSQDVADARARGYLLRRAADMEWNQPQRKKCVLVSKDKRSWRSEQRLTSDPEMQRLEFA